MPPHRLLSATLFASLLSTIAGQACPPFTPNLPLLAPLAGTEAIQAAIANLTATFEALIDSNLPSLSSNAFSVDFWSLPDEGSIFTYHWSAPDLVNNTEGVTTVDSNTIYRVASISKVLTVYVFLANAGDELWNHPITEYVPELAEAANATEDETDVDAVRWRDVTIGSLASHLAGISRDLWGTSGLEQQATLLGFPPVPPPEGSYCDGTPEVKFPCDRQSFFNNFLERHPVVAPFHTPIYSNMAFQLLAFALENITSTPYEELVSATFAELPLNSTTYLAPETPDSAIIPINATTSWYGVNVGPFGPGGAFYSSTNDLRAFGLSLLNNTILSPAQTRRWLKPVTFIPDAYAVIGAPWEIFAYPPLSRFPTQLYTKSGSIGLYNSRWGLVPDYNVGFTILGAGPLSALVTPLLTDLVVGAFLPAIEAATIEHAETLFAGNYTDTSGRSEVSISVGTNDYTNGTVLQLDSLTFNGTDLLGLLTIFLGIDTSLLKIDTRIYPSGLKAVGAGPNGTDLLSWRISYSLSPTNLTADAVNDYLSSLSGPFSAGCGGWGTVDGITYGPTALDELLFSVDPQTGEALGIEVRFLQQGIWAKAVAAEKSKKVRKAKRGETINLGENIVLKKTRRGEVLPRGLILE